MDLSKRHDPATAVWEFLSGRAAVISRVHPDAHRIEPKLTHEDTLGFEIDGVTFDALDFTQQDEISGRGDLTKTALPEAAAVCASGIGLSIGRYNYVAYQQTNGNTG